MTNTCPTPPSRDSRPVHAVETAARFRALLGRSLDPVLLFGPDGAVLHATPAGAALMGYRPDELENMRGPILIHPDDQERIGAAMAAVLATPDGTTAEEYRVRHRDGFWRWLEARALNLLHEPDVEALVVSFRDVTRRREAEDALRASECRFRALVENSADAVEILGADGTILYATSSVVRAGGRTAAELVGRNAFEWCHPDDASGFAEAHTRFVAEPGAVVSGEYRYQHKDGSWRWAAVTCTNRLGDPAVSGIVVNLRDVTARKDAEDALRRSEEQYRHLFEASPHPMWVYDTRTLGFLAVNDAAVDRYGYARDEFARMTIRDIRPGEDLPALGAALRVHERAPRVWRHRWKDGTVRLVEVTGDDLEYDGRPGRLVLAHDVTDRTRAEDEVRAWKVRYEAAVRATGQVLYDWDAGNNRLSWGGNSEATLGYPEAELPDDLAGWVALIHPDDRSAFDHEIERCGASKSPFRLEYRVRRKDGTYTTVYDQGHFIPDPSGVPTERVVGFVSDVTDRKRLEEQFRQAQKMEAVGQLAGGVAHDFNNLLTVINGYSDLILTALHAHDPARPMVEAVRKAGDRAADLTRQLLAFGRQQMLQPRVLDLNGVVGDTAQMLRRLIGEDVELVTRPGDPLLLVRADPGQVNQVLMNLAVNARDAMPTGGTLTIETRNEVLGAGTAPDGAEVRPGPYVRLSVTDTGTGMPEDVRRHIFEPFFTTKEQGKGTGLGLATVYGIVKQSGGHIELETALGHGTTFRVYLPGLGGTTADQKPGESSAPKGAEVVLLVEDEPGVRGLAELALRKQGYTVLSAASAEEAKALVTGRERPIDLLVTDVVMPGVGGRVLAEWLLATRPSLKVLYMSGYTDDAIVRHGVEAARVNFIQKPFTPSSLARKVREVLDARSPHTS
ncbi:multi-sensor hybrid histidine kinase : PAS/PAC sensor hybrid histidine kinase OS=uncultured bacterium GN=ACD_75C00374G0005 PE=4 SV=1: PAS_4: PAS_3: PAS_8: PAS_3: HisKA: HATPase_c: Response_reg [Gemmata massiliana]|uniref:histidine kinase n=1 Tax=Gemmata massiliana TaxID=1210884 RepID=A0A6P2D9I9_9BACT|nr:PAS domain S-box protein [Gemmata massiliana]VTR96150.1 multi-sensor hybrid histidine kinase : PAS/PAC sensor hybrid histidine kinase OS=uncultured bacterium GN=ACD_75C00374G0005 PE=4 SV=1: PAS_4: PAS_3: PAS_8: PAS_3: HisKA: HATPase_c: Response_reg [Gemmata massiliana]